ncbi:unnamed protein product [Phytophthora fragariaefolia]|uniref:Unnamed protein product n=1 Tax=Phytophthora fragariaefolia TaxID=1490495 RepID=A0A9W7CZ53_9STRA|nr:unnamed protein product [Phytophthora fragariaefolia]
MMFWTSAHEARNSSSGGCGTFLVTSNSTSEQVKMIMTSSNPRGTTPVTTAGRSSARSRSVDAATKATANMPRSVKFDRVGDQDHGRGGSDDGSEDGVMMMGPRPILGDEEVDEQTVYVGESGAPCPIARRLESEVGEVFPAIALAPDERSTTGSRLLMKGNPPNAYKRLEQVGRSMVATSAWMMMFGPKRIDGAKWVTLEKELSRPIDSPGLTQLAEQTKRLLAAMGFEYTDISSKKTLTWPGFQTTSRKRELFSKFAESLYSMGSHMVTPKKSLGGRRIYDGADDDDDNDNAGRDYADACEGLTNQTRRSYHHVDDDGAQRIKLTHHISLSKLPKFNGRRNRTEYALKWLRVLIYEMQGTNTSQDCWHVSFELCMEDGASYWIRQLPQGTRTRWPQLCEAFINYYGAQYHESAELKYYTAQQELSEHMCDYMLRLNGYARSANVIYDKGGAAGARHVKQFLTTSCDGDMVANIIPQRFDNIADVEVVINEIMAAERRRREQRNYVQMLGSTNTPRRYFRSTHHGPHSGRNNRIRTRNAKFAEIPEERLMITQQSEDVHDDDGLTINQSRKDKLLLDSVISKSLAKKLKLIASVSAGRRISVQGFTEAKVSSCEWDTVKLTLGSELTYELIIWVVPQCAGVDVILGMDFMIPAGVRLDLLRSTMLNPDEVVIPLLKSLRETDDRSSAKHVPGGPRKPLEYHDWQVLAYGSATDKAALSTICHYYDDWLAKQPSTVYQNVSAHFTRSPENQAAAVETRKKSGRTPANHAGSDMCYMLIASSRSSKPAGDEGVDLVTQRTAGNSFDRGGAVTKQLAKRQQLRFDDADWRSTAEITRPSNANRTKMRTPCERKSDGGHTAEPKSFQLSRMLTDQVPICLPGYKGYVISFSGSANLDSFAEQCSCSWILWSLPTRDIVTAACSHLQSATTTIAKCTGLSKGIWMAIEHGMTDLIVVGDLKVAVQQSIGATVRRQQRLSESSARQKKCAFRLTSIRYHQVAREYNSSARSLAAEALEIQISKIVLSEPSRAELKALNRIQEALYIDEQTVRERDLPNEQNQAPVRAKIRPVIQAGERLTSVTTRGARRIKFLEPTERQTPSRNNGKEVDDLPSPLRPSYADLMDAAARRREANRLDEVELAMAKPHQVSENARRAKEQIDTLWRLEQLAVSVGDCGDRGGADGDDTVEEPRQPSRFEYSGRVKLFLERVSPT